MHIQFATCILMTSLRFVPRSINVNTLLFAQAAATPSVAPSTFGRTKTTTSSPSPSSASSSDDHHPSSNITNINTTSIIAHYNNNHCNTKCVTSINKPGDHLGGCMGFAGDDCSFPYEVCPDSITQCFGKSAVCVEDKEDGNGNGDSIVDIDTGTTSSYRCDCMVPPTYSIERTVMMGQIEVRDCMDRVTEVCENEQMVSLYAFCTNGGQCAEFVDPGKPHPGCICPGE